jgi:hypothetical protein
MRPGPFSRYFVALEGDEDMVTFDLHVASTWDDDGGNPRFRHADGTAATNMADAPPILSGSIDVAGDVVAEMRARYLGKVAELTDLRAACTWAVDEACAMLRTLAGDVAWMPA